MEADRDGSQPFDQSLFEGRILVEIKAWDANLHVGLCSDLVPPQQRFQGGLNYTRGFAIEGRIAAPRLHRDKAIEVSLAPFGPEILFGDDGLDEVGQLRFRRSKPQSPDLSATLLIPESSLAQTATCLGSIWKFIHLWTMDEEHDRAGIRAFSFSSTIHDNLSAWVAGT